MQIRISSRERETKISSCVNAARAARRQASRQRPYQTIHQFQERKRRRTKILQRSPVKLPFRLYESSLLLRCLTQVSRSKRVVMVPEWQAGHKELPYWIQMNLY